MSLPSWLVKKKKPGAGNELVAACEELLHFRGIFHYRNNSGAYKPAHGGFIRFGYPGSPDIIAVIHGIYVGIECKMGSGRQTPLQKTFQEKLEKAEGIYWLVRSVDELEKLLKDAVL